MCDVTHLCVCVWMCEGLIEYSKRNSTRQHNTNQTPSEMTLQAGFIQMSLCESVFSDRLPRGDLYLAYLCGSVTHQEKYVAEQTFETCGPLFPWNGPKSGALEQPAVEKLLDFEPTIILSSTLPNIPLFNFPESRMKPFPNWDSWTNNWTTKSPSQGY